MIKKIKVAFIFNESNIFLTGNHFDNTYYNFFIKAIPRNSEIEITNFPTKDSFDARILKDKFDIILLWQNNEFGMPKNIIGIDDLNIPVISRIGDLPDAQKSIPYHKKWKIDAYFHFFPKSLVSEFYPSNFHYKCIIYGLETSLYTNLKSFNERIDNKILNSGAVANTKPLSKLINKFRKRKQYSLDAYYLRTKCNELPYVDYTSTLQHQYIIDKYPLLLEKYKGAIAATSTVPTIKYWEIPAAGCLTFMEMTKINRGTEILDYVDGESVIYIDKDNYKNKFTEFLKDPKNPKWANIANNGKKISIQKYNNDEGVKRLVQLMKEFI
jgi:hypothetical protein